MTAHRHTATAETIGHWAEVCECGAVRLLDRKTNTYCPWHSCHLCCLQSQEGPEVIGR